MIRAVKLLWNCLFFISFSANAWAACPDVIGQLKPGVDYVQGEIIVNFTAGVDGPEALAILKETGFDAKKDVVPVWTISLKVQEGHIIEQMKILEASGFFEYVDARLDVSGNQSNEIVVTSALEKSHQEILEFIKSQNGLEIVSEEQMPLSILVGVTAGLENDAICQLTKHSMIESADLNEISTLD